MGWTYTKREKGDKIQDFFQRRFGESHKILDCAVVGFRTAYMAIRNETGDVFAAIIKLDYRKDEYYNFGWKDMDETQNPPETDCPERILRQLSALGFGFESSLAWRNACWEKIKRRKALPAIRTGARIITDEPIHFRVGKISDFVVVNAERLIFAQYTRQWGAKFKISRKTLQRVGYRIAPVEA